MNPTDLLWTGGWDSTFRLCELALMGDSAVQPIYMLDDRAQRLLELGYIDRLWHEVRGRASSPERLRRPVIYQWSKRDRAPNHLQEVWDRMSTRYDALGPQYLKLAALADELDAQDLELCWAQGEVRDQIIENLFVDPTSETLERRRDTDEAVLFERFTTPTLRYSKADMRQIAEVHGFLDILRTTWFCEKPIRNKPCGDCGPCTRAHQSGEPFEMARRHDRWLHQSNRELTRLARRTRKVRGRVVKLLDRVR